MPEKFQMYIHVFFQGDIWWLGWSRQWLWVRGWEQCKAVDSPRQRQCGRKSAGLARARPFQQGLQGRRSLDNRLQDFLKIYMSSRSPLFLHTGVGMRQVWLQGRTTCSRGEETSIDFWHTLQMMGEAGQPKCQKGGGGITQSWRLLMARDGNRPLFSLTEIEYSGNSLFVQRSIGFRSRLHGSHLRLPERGKHGHLPDVKEGYCSVLFLNLI